MLCAYEEWSDKSEVFVAIRATKSVQPQSWLSTLCLLITQVLLNDFMYQCLGEKPFQIIEQRVLSIRYGMASMIE